MEFKVSAVVKRNGKWFIGYLDGPKFKETKQVKRLKDVKEVTNYKTFKKYLKDRSLSLSLEPLILERLGLQSIYILDRPIEPSAEEFEAWWWNEMSEICKKCKLTCKQSGRVTVVSCALFRKEE